MRSVNREIFIDDAGNLSWTSAGLANQLADNLTSPSMAAAKGEGHAIGCLESVFAKAPENANAASWLANCLQGLGKAVRHNDPDTALGKFDRGAEILNELLLRDPDNRNAIAFAPVLFVARAQLLADLGRDDEALADVDRTIELVRHPLPTNGSTRPLRPACPWKHCASMRIWPSCAIPLNFSTCWTAPATERRFKLSAIDSAARREQYESGDMAVSPTIGEGHVGGLLGSTPFNNQSTLLVGSIVDDDVQIDLRSGNKSLIFAADQNDNGVMIPGDLTVTSNSNSNQTIRVQLELVLVGGKTTFKLKT